MDTFLSVVRSHVKPKESPVGNTPREDYLGETIWNSGYVESAERRPLPLACAVAAGTAERNGVIKVISKSKWRRQHSYGEQLCDACVQFSQPEHNAVVGGDPMNQNREWLLVFHTT